MDLALSGKVALVCAASAGIGKAIALGLAREGVSVAIVSRGSEAIAAAAAEIAEHTGADVLALTGDLGVAGDVTAAYDRTVERFGRVDILINNQGGPAPGTILELGEEQLDSAIDTNLRSVYRLVRLCLPGMVERGFGRIVNILSITAKEPPAGMLLSNMMRPAILGLSKTIAVENAATGVTSNSLLPSAVLTQRATTLLERTASTQGISFDEALANLEGSLPIRRMASPEEFARLAVFLCSPEASYITGTAIPVDGASGKGI
jgi:3-oxoacyl-[acyl-carrier protein] reductase